jgi:hypothetical protein
MVADQRFAFAVFYDQAFLWVLWFGFKNIARLVFIGPRLTAWLARVFVAPVLW